jgi:hypothetical protein
MCYKIVITKGKTEIETPGQFFAHFGFEAKRNTAYKDVDMNACLCQCDVEETLTERGISFTTEAGDIYVPAPVKTCDKKCSSCSKRYPMTRLEKQVQLDCRLTSCRFYQGAGVCNNVSPAITLSDGGRAICWSKEER